MWAFPGAGEKNIYQAWASQPCLGLQPADIQAAAEGGAHAVGVCTGAFSKADLLRAARNACPVEGATVINDLHDNEEVLAACKLSPQAGAEASREGSAD